MRKFTVPGLCKTTLLVIVSLLLSLTRLQAQFDIQIGTGTAANTTGGFPCPLQDAAEASRMQYLYKASELTAMGMKAGDIRAISFIVVSLGTAGPMENAVFKIGTTTSNSLAASNGGWDNFTGTPVATVAADFQARNGVNKITFPTPFTWNGIDNILIEVCNGSPAATSSNTYTLNPQVAWTTGLPFNGSHTYQAYNIAAGCGATASNNAGTQTTRPNIIFDWVPAGTCDGTFNAGVALSSVPAASSLCNPQTFTLSWQGTVTSGMTIQWQVSSDDATWTNIPGATALTYTGTQMTTSYYRALITCNTATPVTSKGSASVIVNSVPLVMPLPSGPYKIDNSILATDPAAGKFKTFTDAYNFIKCGIGGPIVFDVVNTGVVYNEQLIMQLIPGTSATNTVTFNGNGATLAFKPTANLQRAVIKLNDADYVTFNNLIIQATSTTTGEYGWAVHLLNNADNNTIKNCTIRTVVPPSFMYYLSTGGQTEQYAGIVISPADNQFANTTINTLCDNNVFDNNTIEGGSVGISIQGSNTSGIMNNKIINNTIKNFGRAGIIVGGSTNTLIENNDISRPDVLNNSDAFNFPAIQGILGVTYNANLLISKNRIHNFFTATPDLLNDFHGISFRLAGGFNNIVANNIVYDIKGQGNLFGMYNQGSDAVSYYHNTISFDNLASYSLRSTYGFYHTSVSADVVFKNNQVSILRGGTGLKYGAYMAETNIISDSLDYNNYYLGANPTFAIGYFNGTTYNTLADWNAGAKLDMHSLNVNPLYTDTAAGNFKPVSNILNDKGVPVGISTDITGANRSTTVPDIGAYEYALAGCLTNFAPGNAFSNVGQTTCPNKSVTLNLKNYDAGSGLTFKWESAASTSGPWTAISGNLGDPVYTFIMGSSSLYYRAAVSCNGGSPRYSDIIQIISGGAFPAGSYTIDNSQPTDPSGTKNFNSFKAAVEAIECGIAGPVVFNVKPGNTAGLYTEQIRIPAINGTSAVNTVTFKSVDDNPASAELKFGATGAAANYVVLLDSAQYINFKALTITATNAVYGRVIEVAGTAYGDSIVNCVINAPAPLANDVTTGTAGIYAATNFKGGSLVIKGNTIKNGAKGVYLNGPAATVYTNNDVIDGNTFTGTYHQPIYALNTSNLQINNNIITLNTTYSTTSFNQGVYGIYTNNCDSALQIKGNQVTISNNTGNLYGIYMTFNEAATSNPAKVMNNKIVANSGLTGTSGMKVGMYTDNIFSTDIINNVITVSAAVPGTSNSSYCAALTTKNAFNVNVYNNSLLNASPATGTSNVYNVTLEIDQQSGKQASSLYGGIQRIYNNVIVNRGGGPAMSFLYRVDFVKSDYNLLFAAGPVLVNTLPTSIPSFARKYATWAAWRDSSGIEINSIVTDPALISNNDLQPNTADPNSWIMQGRGIQLSGNNTDYNGNPRATSLTDGVPDLGAYEFHPDAGVEPPYLTATPATPVLGGTQIFSLATDTVARITWAPTSTLPTAIKLKRYSGVLPAGLAATEKSLYYYVDAEVTGSGSYKYDVKQYFYDSWLRNLPLKSFIKLGKTDATGNWAANATSTIDSMNNIISDTVQTFIGKFTGMTDGLAPAKPVYVTSADSSNKGTRFWLPYALYTDFLGSNAQKLKIYLASDKAAQVTVKVNGTAYSKTYTVAANSTVLTDEIPKTGPKDARITEEGWFKTGISIESTEPISAYMSLQTNTGNNLGSAMLLPTGAYGTNYQALGYRQHSGYPGPQMGASWVNIVADNDNTVIEITPSNPTKGGRAAGVPFRVTLNRGEVYQLIGAYKRSYTKAEHGGPFSTISYEGYELSGTTVVSVANTDGKCLPVGVFSGSSNTTIMCDENNHQPGADSYLFQQNYPDQAWGKHYLTAPLSTINYINERYYHVYRVMVKDPATVVKRNGVVLTNKVNSWYEFTSNNAEYIEADQPVMVAQYNPYNLSCLNDTYVAPRMRESMTYLTPLGHGIKKTAIFRKYADALSTTYTHLTVIIPDQGLASLKIDGSTTVDSVYAHPNKPGYSVVTKRFANVDGISTVESDTTFTATVHAPANIGFYFYNVGMQIPRVEFGTPSIKNVYNISGTPNTYTCAKTPFKPTVMLPVKAKTLTWKLSEATGITPATNVTENNPVPVNKVEINFQDYYVYTLDQSVSFNNTGNYNIPVSATYSQDANSCDKALDGKVDVTVIDAPTVDYTKTYTGCIDGTASFAGTGSTSNGVALDRWNWSFGDNTTANTQNATKKYNAPGTFNVALQAIATDGCVGEVKKDVVVNALPTVTLVKDSLAICTGTNATLAISNPATNATYSWYDQPTGGTATATGVTYTNSYTAKKYYYVGAVLNGCSSVGRTKAVVSIKPDITAPTVAVNNVGINSVSFTWEGVANANSYEVSTDGGATWTTPSSGSTGLSHTINGLRSFQTVSLQVRSIGDCNTAKSNVASATTLSDKVYVPNTFTPNGDGLNDLLQVYVTGAKEVQLMVFNQWGQKVFESNTVSKGWDGTVNGKKQPSGVYLYTCKVVLANGDVIEKNGSVNLIR